MFRIDLRNLVKNKIGICKEYHIQPSEIDALAYYEYETYLEIINEEQKKAQKQQEQQEKEQGMNMPNYGSLMKQAQGQIPKVSAPKMPTMPKISIPKF